VVGCQLAVVVDLEELVELSVAAKAEPVALALSTQFQDLLSITAGEVVEVATEETLTITDQTAAALVVVAPVIMVRQEVQVPQTPVVAVVVVACREQAEQAVQVLLLFNTLDLNADSADLFQ
jgi:hypothetical protein